MILNFHYPPFNEVHIDHPDSVLKTFVVSRDDPDRDLLGSGYDGRLTQCGIYVPITATLPYRYEVQDGTYEPTCMGCILMNLQTRAEEGTMGLVKKLNAEKL